MPLGRPLLGRIQAQRGIASIFRASGALQYALGPKVRVNAIMPGPFLTTISRNWDMDVLAQRTRTFPMRRAGLADEIVGAALYLASDASSYTTGSILTVDGGAQWSMPGGGDDRDGIEARAVSDGQAP